MSDSNELEEDRVVYVAQDEQAIERPVQKCDFFFFFVEADQLQDKNYTNRGHTPSDKVV